MFESRNKQDGSEIVQSLGYWSLLALAAILPVCVLTNTLVPTLFTKTFIGGALILITTILFAIGHIKSQELPIPRSLLLAVSWLIPAAYLLSTLFSTGATSFFGERLSMDSAAFMTFTILALTASAITLYNPYRALGVYLAMLAAAALLTLAELLLLFAPGLPSALGITLSSISLVGSLNDLGAFFGLIMVFALLSLLLLPMTMFIRSILWATLLIGAFFLALVNLTVLWVMVGVFALGCFIYSITGNYLKSGEGTSFSVAALLITLLCGTFLFASDGFTGATAERFGVGQLDVRPSWQSTVEVGSSAIADSSVIFGTGPGTFYHAWAQYMPAGISATMFWLADFPFGIGLVPTSFVTTGLLGAIAWLVFFGVFLYQGLRSLVLSSRAEPGDIASYLHVTSFLGALYLWVLAVIQVPSPVLVIYAALLTGVFIASQRFGAFGKKHIELRFKQNPRVGFLATLVLTLLILGSVGGLYGLTTRHMAEAAYREALNEINTTADVEVAYQYNLRAVTLNGSDVYYRLLSNLDVLRLRALIASGQQLTEANREEFQTLIARAVANAREATARDEADYQNWINLGTVYQSVVPLGVDGALESAIQAYDRALALRPSSPSVLLSKASLERSRGDTAAARPLVEQAISLRNQYSDAIFLLAQFQLEDADTENAIRSVEAITLFEPQNPVAFFQLGLLWYGTEDYVKAAQSFERAISIDTQYANARYFLGLSYWRLGDDRSALEQFRAVRETNPESAVVQSIIENMEAGREPFADSTAADDITELDTLPIQEDGDGAATTTAAQKETLAE
jgi:tetratricopeptide (TPR) repeat protein